MLENNLINKMVVSAPCFSFITILLHALSIFLAGFVLWLYNIDHKEYGQLPGGGSL